MKSIGLYVSSSKSLSYSSGGTYLFLIHETLIEAAKEKGITLDMSKHDERDEGLPYNLPFIIRFENSRDDWFDDDSPEMCPGNPGVGE